MNLKATYMVKMENLEYDSKTETKVFCYENPNGTKFNKFSIVTEELRVNNVSKPYKHRHTLTWCYDFGKKENANKKFKELMKYWKSKNAEIVKL